MNWNFFFLFFRLPLIIIYLLLCNIELNEDVIIIVVYTSLKQWIESWKEFQALACEIYLMGFNSSAFSMIVALC